MHRACDFMSSVRQVSAVLPKDPSARLIGRVVVQGEAPIPILVHGNAVYDLHSLAPTVSGLLEREDLGELFRDTSRLTHLCGIEGLGSEEGDSAEFTLVSPIDLQVVKACGVTFIESMLERLVEERSHGDSARAETFRTEIASGSINGETLKLSEIKPGSPAALTIRQRLMKQGLCSMSRPIISVSRKPGACFNSFVMSGPRGGQLSSLRTTSSMFSSR